MALLVEVVCIAVSGVVKLQVEGLVLATRVAIQFVRVERTSRIPSLLRLVEGLLVSCYMARQAAELVVSLEELSLVLVGLEIVPSVRALSFAATEISLSVEVASFVGPNVLKRLVPASLK